MWILSSKYRNLNPVQYGTLMKERNSKFNRGSVILAWGGLGLGLFTDKIDY